MTDGGDALTTERVFRTWWPLTASWALMALEGPAMNIVVARLADPTIHLAAYGSLVLPLALFIHAPIVMLLSASIALVSDRGAYLKIRRFTHGAGAVLTLVHLLVVCTPFYDLLARSVLHVPEEIIAPGRIGLLLAAPWAWALAYRRFNQGILIRFGHAGTIGVGTLIRLSANALVLAAGYVLGSIPGTAVASAAVGVGIITEGIYAGLRVRPVLRCQLPARESEDPLTYRKFLRFYVPLSLTSLVFLGVRPLFSAAIGRMPNPLDSLAAFPVVIGLIYLFRSTGVAYNEVIVALVGHPGSTRTLRRFTGTLLAASIAIPLVVAATPLSRWWFGTITGLDPELLPLAQAGFWMATALPAITVLQSWYQGIILHSRRTRSITAAVLVYLVVTSALLAVAVMWHPTTGVFAALFAMTMGELVRTLWMGWRGRPAWHALRQRDAASATAPCPSTAPRSR